MAQHCLHRRAVASVAHWKTCAERADISNRVLDLLVKGLVVNAVLPPDFEFWVWGLGLKGLFAKPA